MPKFLKLLVLEIMLVYCKLSPNTDQYNDQFLEAFCNDKKEKDAIICQPMFSTQNDQSYYTQVPSNNQVQYNNQVPSNLVPSNVVPSNAVPSNLVLSNVVPSNVVQQPPSNSVQQVPSNIVQQVQQPPSIQVHQVQQPNVSVKLKPPILQSHPITQKTSVSPPNIGQKLSIVLGENPIARNQLMKFLDYSGVPPPWDQLLDFETTQHHQLPDPDNIFRKIRKQLLKFDKVKTCIVEALIVIEKYITRAKAYLKEDLKDLCRDKILLKNILKRLNTKPAYEFRSELFKRFADVKCQTTATEKSFYKLRDWLIKIKKLFATL